MKIPHRTYRSGGSSFPPSGCPILGCEPVTNLRIGHKVLRRGGVITELLAQLPDKRAQILQLAPILRSPNRPKYAPVRERHAGVRHQKIEQLELLGRQMDWLSRSLYQPQSRIEFYLSNSDRGGFVGPDRL